MTTTMIMTMTMIMKMIMMIMLIEANEICIPNKGYFFKY